MEEEREIKRINSVRDLKVYKLAFETAMEIFDISKSRIWSASSVMMRIKAVTPAQQTSPNRPAGRPGGQAVTALQKNNMECIIRDDAY